MHNNQKLLEYEFVVGIDEVGRGAIAGPLVVGAVIIPVNIYEGKNWIGLKDSKKLTQNKREVWYEKIKKLKGIKTTVSFIPPDKVDIFGIMNTLSMAADNCLKTLVKNPEKIIVLSDYGIPINKEYKYISIKKGDENEPVIALASIWAKVTRDKYMCDKSKNIPNYFFEKNKGYGTEKHIDAIKKFGVSPIHRTTFCSRFFWK